MSSDSRGRDAFFLLAGALIGGAAVYCMYTPEGRAMTRRALDKGAELKDSVVATAEQAAANLKNQAEALAATAQNTAGQVATKVQETQSNIAEAARETAKAKLGSIEEGAARARAKIDAASNTEKA